MSLITARKKRTTLYLSLAGLMVMVAAVSAISARDPSGVSLRVGMIMVTVGAALSLQWRQLIPAVVLAWLVPNLARTFIDDVTLLNLNMALELPGLAGVAFFTASARAALKDLEQENLLVGAGTADLAGLNPTTGIFDENQLRPTLESELARSRRFGRTFSLVLVGIDEMRQKFDYRDEAVWRSSLDATAALLRQTRNKVDRVYHFKEDGFAIILPESTEKDIPGLVKRLRHLAREMNPAEGETGGPLPVHFGATFFPDCATTVDDLMRRAEVALRLASNYTTRYQLDSAEAPEMPPVESLRREGSPSVAASVPITESPPPPAVNNPVAAAIVGEAYAERTREAQAVAEPVLEASTLAPEAEHIEQPVAVSEEPELVIAALVHEDNYEVERPALVMEQAGVESVTETPFPPEYEPAEALLASVVASPRAEMASLPPETMQMASAADVEDDFEALLKQMDETLKLIKSVRSQAA